MLAASGILSRLMRNAPGWQSLAQL
jgi:hypothetical protein